jgi:hypothetical protein
MFCIGFMMLMIGASGMDSPNQVPAIVVSSLGLLLMVLGDRFERVYYIAKRLWSAVVKEAREI